MDVTTLCGSKLENNVGLHAVYSKGVLRFL